jgi:hypothetical protein
MYSLFIAATVYLGYVVYKSLNLDNVVKYSCQYAKYKYNEYSTNIVQLNNKYNVFPYQINNRNYKLLFKRHKEPSRILVITNENGVDVTENVKQYLGPDETMNHNFLTPSLLGYKSLTIIYMLHMDMPIVFNKNDVLTNFNVHNFSQPILDKPILDKPILDKPIMDEPIMDEPIMDEPIMDEPIMDKPIMDEPIMDEPIMDEHIMDKPIMDKPIMDNLVLHTTRLNNNLCDNKQCGDVTCNNEQCYNDTCDDVDLYNQSFYISKNYNTNEANTYNVDELEID